MQTWCKPYKCSIFCLRYSTVHHRSICFISSRVSDSLSHTRIIWSTASSTGIHNVNHMPGNCAYRLLQNWTRFNGPMTTWQPLRLLFFDQLDSFSFYQRLLTAEWTLLPISFGKHVNTNLNCSPPRRGKWIGDSGGLPIQWVRLNICRSWGAPLFKPVLHQHHYMLI